MVFVALLGVLAGSGPVAHASFPFAPQNGVADYTQYRIPSGANKVPQDVQGKLEWMYAVSYTHLTLPTNREV